MSVDRVELTSKLRDVTSSLLDTSRPAYSLRAKVLELKSIFEMAGGLRAGPENDIAAGETITAGGVAISPTMAAMCIDDFARTVQFIRGMYAAIKDLRATIDDRPIRVLYAGCGPWAPLAVPLITVFSDDEATFTLLDVHEESIESVRKIVQTLGTDDHVTAFEVSDASTYRIEPELAPDLILVEMLRAALASEPQVAVVSNLSHQAPDAVVIPQRVSVELALVNLSREFALDAAAEASARDRVVLGTVHSLDRDVIASPEFCPTRIEIPEIDATRYRPMLLTTVQVHGDIVLRDYDSGITFPKSFRVDGDLKTGDVFEFAYEFDPRPRIRAKRINER